jgi:hypothetical protein
MTRRRHAQLHLPPLSPREALTVVAILERTIAAIVRAHGDDMQTYADMRRQEMHARRHGISIYNLFVDPDVDF